MTPVDWARCIHPEGNGTYKMSSDSNFSEIDTWLKQNPRLHALECPTWRNAVKDSVLATVPANTVISGACDEAGNWFVIVLAGSLKIQSTTADGRILAAYRVEAGELCALSLPIMFGALRHMVRASTEVQLVLLKTPIRYLDSLRTYSHAFRDFQFSSIANQFSRLINRVEEFTFFDLETRIHRHLQAIASSAGSRIIPISHQSLADDLGSKREAISRALKELERRGALRLGRRQIELLPPAAHTGHQTPINKSVRKGTQFTLLP